MQQFLSVADVDVGMLSDSVYGTADQESNANLGSAAFDIALRHVCNGTPSVLVTFSEYTVALYFDEEEIIMHCLIHILVIQLE